MIKKNIILIGIFTAILLFVVAAFYYPGGSQIDKNTIGYDWENNYLCHLFNDKAINGKENASMLWAILGMFVLCVTISLFFIRFSNKIKSPHAALIIRYTGSAAMLAAFFVITPYHDVMTTIASILALITLFYITIFIFRSNLKYFKLLSVFCILILYVNNFIYYTGQFLRLLPVMQKISFVCIVIWILGLEYFTTKGDFQLSK